MTKHSTLSVATVKESNRDGVNNVYLNKLQIEKIKPLHTGCIMLMKYK